MPDKEKKFLFLLSKDSIFLFLFSIFFISFSFLTVETKLGSAFTVNIPLNSKFPIPIFFWLGVFAYLLIVSKILRINFKKIVWLAAILGFSVHFIFLLLNILIWNEGGKIPWHSKLYLLYFQFILYFTLCFLSIWAGILFHFSLTDDRFLYLGLIYSIPLLYIYSCITMLIYRHYFILFVMFALFFLAFSSRKRVAFYARVKKKFIFFLNLIFNEKVFLLLIFIVSLFFRIAFLKSAMGNPNYIYTASDGKWMHLHALDFLAGKPTPSPQSKAYWIFLAGIYYFFGAGYFSAGVIQSLYGALAVLMAYIIAKKTFGIITARATAIIAALDYSLIFSAGGLGHQAMDIFYGVLIVYLLVKFKEIGFNFKGIALLGFTGFMCGLAMANREVNVLMPIVASVWVIYLLRKSVHNKFKIAAVILFFLIFSLIGVTPFLHLNYLQSGSLYSQSSTYGVKHILGDYNPDLRKIGFNPIADFNNSLKIIYQQPLIFLKAFWLNYYHKFMRLYFDQDYGGFDPIFLVRSPNTNYYLSMWFYAYLVTLVGSVFGFLKMKKNDKVIFYLIVAVIVYKTAFHLITIGIYRYRAAIEPFLIMLAAYGIYIVIKFIQGKIETVASTDG